MTSSEDEHILIDLLLNKRWDEATSRTNTEEGREDLRIARKNMDKDEYGELPLHVACHRRAPLELVKAMLEGNKEARRKAHGMLPLHWACYYSAPLELVEAMLEGYKEAVRVDDMLGALPLHYACRPFLLFSPPVVRLLLDAYPEGAKAAVRDQYRFLPLHLTAISNAPSEVLTMLIDAHPEGVATRDAHGRLPLHWLADKASPDKEEDVEKVELLFRPLLDDEGACLVRDPHLRKTPLHIGVKFDVLNLLTCVRIPRCPATVITTVAKRHPEQLRERGEDGSLPLHLAAANPNLNGAQDGQEDLIAKLVRLYPDAAAASDGEGRCPLNLAIESGKGWKEGVEAIAYAAKSVRTIRDVGTNLFPFMLAASRADPCITTVYELLRCCPDICKKP